MNQPDSERPLVSGAALLGGLLIVTTPFLLFVVWSIVAVIQKGGSCT